MSTAFKSLVSGVLLLMITYIFLLLIKNLPFQFLFLILTSKNIIQKPCVNQPT